MTKLFKQNWPIILLLILHLLLLLNLRFTAWPEMLSYPMLKNSGYLLYKDMIHPYPPVLTLLLAVGYKFIGVSVDSLKLLTWSALLFNDLAFFAITRSLFKKTKHALFLTSVYILLQPVLEGNMLWFDIAIITPLLVGFYFAIHSKFFLSSLFLTAAGLTKQTGGLFFIVFVIWLILNKVKYKQLRNVFLASLALFAPLIIRLLQEGALVGFWQWVIYYPFSYWSNFPGYVQMSLEQREVIVMGILLLPAIYIGIKSIQSKRLDKKFLLLISFVATGLVSIYPRFSFFHLQTALPFIILLWGYGLLTITKKQLIISVSTLSFFLLWFLYKPALQLETNKETRFYESEDKQITFLIKSATSPGEKIFLFNIHSGIYSYADRLPSKPWGDTFGWYYEIPGIQDKTLQRWQTDPPEHIFWKEPGRGNWFDLGVYQPRQIVEWIESNYNRISEIMPGVWHWRIKV